MELEVREERGLPMVCHRLGRVASGNCLTSEDWDVWWWLEWAKGGQPSQEAKVRERELRPAVENRMN